jgi:hypothetical protein
MVTLPHDKFEALAGASRDRLYPKLRGVHPNAVQAGIAPTSASTCVDCGRAIPKGQMRWGIRYGGNPLPLPVVPLYGHMPMVMWCHGPTSSSTNTTTSTKATTGGAFCGVALVRLEEKHSDPASEGWLCAAARTCHVCSDGPDAAKDSATCGSNLRVLCGGRMGERGKLREHAFHIQCWKDCLVKGSANFNREDKQALESALQHPEAQWRRHSKTSAVFDEVLAYQDLTRDEQALVRHELDL